MTYLIENKRRHPLLIAKLFEVKNPVFRAMIQTEWSTYED